MSTYRADYLIPSAIANIIHNFTNDHTVYQVERIDNPLNDDNENSIITLGYSMCGEDENDVAELMDQYISDILLLCALLRITTEQNNGN